MDGEPFASRPHRETAAGWRAVAAEGVCAAREPGPMARLEENTAHAGSLSFLAPYMRSALRPLILFELWRTAFANLLEGPANSLSRTFYRGR